MFDTPTEPELFITDVFIIETGLVNRETNPLPGL